MPQEVSISYQAVKSKVYKLVDAMVEGDKNPVEVQESIRRWWKLIHPSDRAVAQKYLLHGAGEIQFNLGSHRARPPGFPGSERPSGAWTSSVFPRGPTELPSAASSKHLWKQKGPAKSRAFFFCPTQLSSRPKRAKRAQWRDLVLAEELKSV